MSSNKKETNWNVWGRANVRTERAAPVVLFDESSRKEYVSGFTKRKQQRRLIAQVAIKTKEKQMRKDERKKRKDETDSYIEALTGAKDEAMNEDGEFIDASDRKDLEEFQRSTSKGVAVGSEATYATEDGGKVTATVSTFDDEDYEDLPALIPIPSSRPAPSSSSGSSSASKGALPKKPKLRGNTATSGNISSSLKSKKRKNDHGDRKGFQKKPRN